MNKKGFTLIELLAVVVILLVLATLVGLGVARIVKKAKTNILESEKQAIIKAAENWGADNIFELSDTTCQDISVQELISEGFLSEFDDDKFENIDISTAGVRICPEYSSTYETYSYTYTYVDNIN